MKLDKARPEQIGALAAISKAAFDSDVDVGADYPDGPPEYDSEPWHIEMMNRGNLYAATEEGEVIGGALLFRDASAPDFLYVGRIFIDPRLFGRGYGMRLMELIENMNPDVTEFCLDTPLWNIRTNRFYRKLGYTETKRDEKMVFYRKRRL